MTHAGMELKSAGGALERKVPWGTKGRGGTSKELNDGGNNYRPRCHFRSAGGTLLYFFWTLSQQVPFPHTVLPTQVLPAFEMRKKDKESQKVKVLPAQWVIWQAELLVGGGGEDTF